MVPSKNSSESNLGRRPKLKFESVSEVPFYVMRSFDFYLFEIARRDNSAVSIIWGATLVPIFAHFFVVMAPKKVFSSDTLSCHDLLVHPPEKIPIQHGTSGWCIVSRTVTLLTYYLLYIHERETNPGNKQLEGKQRVTPPKRGSSLPNYLDHMQSRGFG